MTFITRHLYILLALATLLFLVPIAGIARAATAIISETADTAAAEKCYVCHNGRNPHTVRIRCSRVPTYLANHPGDYEGPCTGITEEKPGKPRP